MTIMSADIGRLAAAVARRVRAMATRFTHPFELKTPAKPRDHSHPGFYGLSTTRDSASAVKERPDRLDAATEHGNAQTYLPIGPCCC